MNDFIRPDRAEDIATIVRVAREGRLNSWNAFVLLHPHYVSDRGRCIHCGRRGATAQCADGTVDQFCGCSREYWDELAAKLAPVFDEIAQDAEGPLPWHHFQPCFHEWGKAAKNEKIGKWVLTCRKCDETKRVPL
jgi:hypothetical protein